MPEVRIRGRDYRRLNAIEIVAVHGVIQAINPLDASEPLPLLAPGLVDLQVNGFMGIDFNHFPFSVAEVEQATQALWRQGVTTFLPTVITASARLIEQALARLAEACQQSAVVAQCVAGIHLEGPFLSSEEGPRGAHPLEDIRAPDRALFHRWQQAAGGRIRLLTLSPEWENSASFIAQTVSDGVVVSLGHTSATPEQIRQAVESGARMSTHLGNGAHLQLPRHPNYIWQQLAEDELACALIADGEHLPLAVLKVFLRAKGNQALLVSDVTSFAGMPAGDYDAPIGGRVHLSEQGRLSLANDPRLLAGSVSGLLQGVNHLLKHNLCSRIDALEMASLRPARQLDLPQQQGIAVGAPCDIIQLISLPDGQLALQAVWKQGERVMIDAPARE